MKFVQIIPFTFKLACISAAVCMIFFWIVEYQRNESTTLIEYKSIREIRNVTYPELTICMDHPFLNNELTTFSSDLDKIKYLDHLKGGNSFNYSYNNISYDQVTPNLFKYLDQIWIGWKPSPNNLPKYCADHNNCSYFTFTNNYNGISDITFLKCFGIQLNENYIHEINSFQLIFNESLSDVLSQIKRVFVTLNQPNQFTRNSNGVQYVWNSPKGIKRKDFFQITSIDILKRRNKVQEPCLVDWYNFDTLALKPHIAKVGCRPPYHIGYEKFPSCRTQSQMKASIYDPWSMDNTDLPKPCQEMPNIFYKHSFKDTDVDLTVRQTFKIWATYPKKGKVITELRAVNIHSLIGNIGGYIGLFLGKANQNNPYEVIF